LNFAQVITNCIQIKAKPSRVRQTRLLDFFNNGIDHFLFLSNSSGEQTSGHTYPSASISRRMMDLVKALLMCVKFHVRRKSIPFRAATDTLSASSRCVLGIAPFSIRRRANALAESLTSKIGIFFMGNSAIIGY
jgi:hypothetical protein